MDDETAKHMQEHHLAHCRACQFMVNNHSLSGNVKETIKQMTKEIKRWEKKEKKVFIG